MSLQFGMIKNEKGQYSMNTYINGKLQSVDDAPSMVYENGDKYWHDNDKLHREGDKPAAMISTTLRDDVKAYTYEWRVNGHLHRAADKPAIEHANGDREWWVGGVRHRANGKPAIELVDGHVEYYEYGLLMGRGREKPVVTEKYHKLIFIEMVTQLADGTMCYVTKYVTNTNGSLMLYVALGIGRCMYDVNVTGTMSIDVFNAMTVDTIISTYSDAIIILKQVKIE